MTVQFAPQIYYYSTGVAAVCFHAMDWNKYLEIKCLRNVFPWDCWNKFPLYTQQLFDNQTFQYIS